MPWCDVSSQKSTTMGIISYFKYYYTTINQLSSGQRPGQRSTDEINAVEIDVKYVWMISPLHQIMQLLQNVSIKVWNTTLSESIFSLQMIYAK